MGVAAPVNWGGKVIELVAAQLFVPLSLSRPHLPGARFFLFRAFIADARARLCRLRALPCRADARGRVTSALFHLNNPQGECLGELSMLPQYLSHPVMVRARRNDLATVVNGRSSLQLVCVRISVPCGHPASLFES
jgi:hypothetical protein